MSEWNKFCIFAAVNDKIMAQVSMTGLEAFQQIRKMAESGQLPDLTLDEINEEIRLAREDT